MANPQFESGISAITYPIFDSAWNSLKVPDYYNKIAYKYGRENIMGLMDTFATQTTRADKTYYHVENGRLQPAITVNAGAAAGAGLPVTLTLQSASHALSGTASPVQPQYLVILKDGTNCVVTAKSTAVDYAHTITIYPNNNTYTISVAAGETLMVVPVNYVGAGSCPGLSELELPGTVYSNTMQTVRKDFQVTGEMLAAFNGKMLLVEGMDRRTGEWTNCWYNKDLGDYEQKFFNSREIALLIGQPITNTTLSGSTYGLSGMTGLIPSIEAGGNVHNYAGAVGFKISDIQDMVIRMDKELSPKEYWVKGGSEFINNLQNEIKSFFPNGAVSYASFNNSQDEAIKWGFTSVGMYDYTFHLGKLPVFNNPTMLGAPGFRYGGNALFIPAAQTADQFGMPTSYIQITHLEGCGYGRYFDFNVTGGASWLPKDMRTDACDSVTFSWLEQFGIEVFLANHFYYVKKS